MTVVAVIAPGAMGAGVGKRLTENGVEVITPLDGRSAASTARAEAAGMRGVPEAALAGADVILSIVPPAEALPLARRLAPVLAGAERKPVYADCNAVSPQTVLAVEAALASTGAPFVDACILGLPPVPGEPSPLFCTSGPAAQSLDMLGDHGLRIRRLSGPVGAASGLKMSYAGITKGLTALGTAMVLAATRFGGADALREEMASSQAPMLARFQRNIPDMFPKAYRWVAEMREIADFAEGDPAAQAIYRGIADLYERIAADVAADGPEIAALREFLKQG